MVSSTLLKQISSNRSFKGYQKVFEHESSKLRCAMKFGIYLPDNEEKRKLPVLFWLSGITCTEENFIVKSGMQRFASAHQIIVVNPDTSPRGDAIPVGFEDNPTLGNSAGFYLNATTPKFAHNYQMYAYIVEEFVPLIFSEFSIDQSQCGIFGHSMGGHGALQIGMKNPGLFKSISTFAPICNPSNAPNFGQNYFTAFLGPFEESRERWAEFDSTEVAKKYTGPKREILIDQGLADPFLSTGYLLPQNLLAASNPNLLWQYRAHEDYDHGYFFIHTFIEDHFLFHKRCWSGNSDGENATD